MLIVGSDGFIGNNLVDAIRSRNIAVYGCDVQSAEGRTDYFCINAEEKGFDSLFQKTLFDICINCSGAASVPDSLTNPLRDFELNTVNVFKILDAIRRHQPECKFMNLSSAAVYGNPSVLPVKESDPANPVSPYGLHKLQAEQICKSFATYWNVCTCSMRIFSAYGVGLRKQLFWDLYQKAQSASNINLFGTGHETRDFIYIADIIQAIDLVLQHSDFNGECINVANGKQISTREAAETFLHSLGWHGDIMFQGEGRKGDPLNWEADISKLRSWGYAQKYSLGEGLTQYVQWLKKT